MKQFPWSAPMLSALRIVAALMFLEHGTGKFFNFPPLPRLPVPGTMPWYAGILELVGGLLLLVGLFSRPVAFVLAGEMAVAYWLVHFPRSPFPLLNSGELAALYCFVFLYLAAAGPGPWSLDARRRAW
jgi:putative oxidoreductase